MEEEIILQIIVPDPPGPIPMLSVTETGQRGAKGDSSDGAIYPAGESIGGHRGVKLANDGTLYYADSSDTSDAGKLVGISVNAATPPDDVTVRWSGEVEEPSWNWAPGLSVYLGTSGLLTQTAPTSGFLQRIGFAPAADKIFLQIGQAVILS